MSLLQVLACALLLAAPAGPPAKRARPPLSKKAGEIHITSDSFEALPDRKQGAWKGRVVVVRDDLRIQCASLVADLAEGNQVRKVTCTGNAYMHQAASPKLKRAVREAWGEVAVFDNVTGLLTVTGSPRAREGDNTMEGERILLDTEADKVRVERPTMTLRSPPPAKAPAKEPRQ